MKRLRQEHILFYFHLQLYTRLPRMETPEYSHR